MNINHLIIFTFILTILTVSAVSASEGVDNLTSDALENDNEISVDNVDLDDSVSESYSSDDVVSLDSSSSLGKTYNVSDFRYGTNGDLDPLTTKYDTVLHFYDNPVSGNLLVYVDGAQRYNKTLNVDSSIFIEVNELGINKDGYYTILFKFITEDKQEITFDDFGCQIKVKDWGEISNEHIQIFSTSNFLNKEDSIGYVYDGDDVNGTVSVFIDNVRYFSKKLSLNDTSLYISSADLNLGNSFKVGKHKVRFVYLRNGTEECIGEKTVNFLAKPGVVYPDFISKGDIAYLIINFLKGSTGTVKVYNAVAKFDELDPSEYILIKGKLYKSVSISNDMVVIPLTSLPVGTNYFLLDMNANTYKENNIGIEIEVKENSPGFSASISSTFIKVGSVVTVTVNGPKVDDPVRIYVDNILFNSVSLSSGVVQQQISGLKVGNHIISVYNNGENFYSKSFSVTVKKSINDLSLKKVKVKRSAKKLVLSATLKIYGKVASGKKVSFKFNKVKLSGKTNSKGVVKVTVKKKFLKKLKVGKKVKYLAKFSDVSKSFKVKVSK